jgi:hypothetical protein
LLRRELTMANMEMEFVKDANGKVSGRGLYIIGTVTPFVLIVFGDSTSGLYVVVGKRSDVIGYINNHLLAPTVYLQSFKRIKGFKYVFSLAKKLLEISSNTEKAGIKLYILNLFNNTFIEGDKVMKVRKKDGVLTK